MDRGQACQGGAPIAGARFDGSSTCRRADRCAWSRHLPELLYDECTDDGRSLVPAGPARTCERATNDRSVPGSSAASIGQEAVAGTADRREPRVRAAPFRPRRSVGDVRLQRTGHAVAEDVADEGRLRALGGVDRASRHRRDAPGLPRLLLDLTPASPLHRCAGCGSVEPDERGAGGNRRRHVEPLRHVVDPVDAVEPPRGSTSTRIGHVPASRPSSREAMSLPGRSQARVRELRRDPRVPRRHRRQAPRSPNLGALRAAVPDRRVPRAHPP